PALCELRVLCSKAWSNFLAPWRPCVRQSLQFQSEFLRMRLRTSGKSIVVEAFFGEEAEVSEADVVSILEDAGLRDILEGAVFDQHVGDFGIRQADEVERPTALFAGDVL